MSSSPRTVEEIYKDHSARRAGIVRALTYDVDDFYNRCDPEKENLCLYGHPNESWEVNLPADEVPPELPEPALGINFARDGMNRRDWLSLVAVHSDCWLLSVSFYFGAHLKANERVSENCKKLRVSENCKKIWCREPIAFDNKQHKCAGWNMHRTDVLIMCREPKL